MKLTRMFASTAIAATLLCAGAAHAEMYLFTVSGDYSATWQLDTDQVPTGGHVGESFHYLGVGGSFPGSSWGIADIYFRNSSVGGGLYIIDAGNNVPLMLSEGPQLYGGSEVDPEFMFGTHALTDVMGPGSYTFTISPVPEPATYGMMLAGLGLVGVALRRRQGK